jgi:hypothetical protein
VVAVAVAGAVVVVVVSLINANKTNPSQATGSDTTTPAR